MNNTRIEPKQSRFLQDKLRFLLATPVEKTRKKVPSNVEEKPTLVKLGSTAQMDNHPPLPRSIQLSDFADATKREIYINKVAQLHPKAKRPHIGSIITKRLPFLLVAQCFAISVCRKELVFSLEQCYLESKIMNKKWIPHFRINTNDVQIRPLNNRQERHEALTRAFVQYGQLMKKIKESTKVCKQTIADNAWSYLSWLYQREVLTEIDPQTNKLRPIIRHSQLRLKQDLRFIKDKLFPQTFGLPVEEQRKSCCTAYIPSFFEEPRKTLHDFTPEDYQTFMCSTCPILTKKQMREGVVR